MDSIVQHCETTKDLPEWKALCVSGMGWVVNDGDMLQLFDSSEEAQEYVDYFAPKVTTDTRPQVI